MDNSIEQLLADIKELTSTTTTKNEIPDHESSSISNIQASLQSFSDKLVNIEAELGEIKSFVENSPSLTQSHYSTPTSASNHSNEPVPSLSNTTYTDIPQPCKIEHKSKYIEFSEDNFLNKDQISATLDFLNSEQYQDENGRSVSQYGTKYKYMGSKAVVKDMAPQIQAIMDTLNAKYTKGKYVLNSCLVNRYTGTDSFLPEHADDEFSIMPDSHIFTVSLGAPRIVTYADQFSNVEIKHTCLSGSLYTMSKDSQAFYKHRIDRSDEDGVRYSLTFRCIHYSNLNSTLIIGDSNTGKLRFGSGLGTLGRATPGRQHFAAKVNDINPIDCASHSNIVLMVGTNNLKQKDVLSNNHIIDIFKTYKQKIISIRQINRHCNIIVCPVLLTKLPLLNRKIGFFNTLLREDLLQCDVGVSLVWIW